MSHSYNLFNPAPEQITVYMPNTRGGGLIRTAVRSVGDIRRHRHLIWMLFSRDFKAQFKQSLLGYFWALIGPVMGVFGFVYLNYVGILNPGVTSVPYPLYAFVGTTLWSFLASTIGLMSNGLNAQADLIMRTNVPKIALAASALAGIAYSAFVSLVLVTLALIIFQMPFHIVSLAFIVLSLPLVVLGIGIGLIVSVLGIIIRDAGRLVSQGLAVLMLFTPVIFVSENIHNHILHILILANPLTYLVEVPRSILFGQHTAFWPQYVGGTLLSIAVLLMGVKVFDIVQDLVAERL